MIEKTLETLLQYSGYLTGIFGALALLWRYAATPLRAAIKRPFELFDQIAEKWPLLVALLERFSQPSGPGSLLSFLESLDNRLDLAESRLFAFLDLSTRPVFQCAVTGECVFANEQICELFGMSKADMMGFGWLLGVSEADRDRTNEVWLKAVKNQRPYEATYHVSNRRNGKFFSVTARGLPLMAGSEIVGYHGVLSNVFEKVPQPKAQRTPANVTGCWIVGNEYHLSLSCGHEFCATQTPETTHYLQTHPRILCPECNANR